MKRIKFELQIYCTVGWDDNEDTGLLEVDTFDQVLEIASTLKKRNRASHKENEKTLEAYKEIKEAMVSKSGEEIMYVGEVIGIQCLYEDDKGVQVGMTLSDNSGVSGWAKINSEDYDNEYKRLLGEAKKLATNIARL